MKVCATNGSGANDAARDEQRQAAVLDAKSGDRELDCATSIKGGAFDKTMTLEEFIDYCARLQPVEAAQQEDSALCVTPLVSRLIVDGKLVTLVLKGGKWGAGYTRVSDLMQRSAKSVQSNETFAELFLNANDASDHDDTDNDDAEEKIEAESPSENEADVAGQRAKTRKPRRKGRRRVQYTPDGFSEEEQLNRQVRYFVARGEAFRIYSDCGITGEYPTNDPVLIRDLLTSQAARYQKIFRRTLLDETSRLRRTPEQIASMEAYLAQRITLIKRGSLSDEEIDASEDLGERAKRRLRGNKKKAYFRQALTQLWRDIEAGYVHTVAVSDRSRLCRAADLENAILRLLFEHKVRLVGLIEDLTSLDVSDPVKRGLNYLVGGINEYRLEELAGHALRGVLQLLESGRPNGRLPWWLERDDEGRAALIEERAQVVRRITQMSLSGLGIGAIINRLHEEGVRVNGASLTRMQLSYMLQSDALTGTQDYFGLKWPAYVPVIDAETMNELRERNAERGVGHENLHDTRTWAEHSFTGVLRCVCGSPLIFTHAAPERIAVGDLGYYNCKRPFRASGVGDPIHGNINHQKLETFFAEVFRGSPHLIADALTAGGARVAGSRARRAVLDERWRVASAEYEARSKAAFAEAEARAFDLMGLRTGAVGYQAVVEGLQANILENETAKMTDLRQEMLVANQESSRDREAARALEAVDALKGWDGLNSQSRNRLLRAVFSHITVYPLGNRKRPGCGGYLEVKLAGTEIALPPIRLHRGGGRGIFLPTVAEWIASFFSPDVADLATRKEENLKDEQA